VPGSRTGSPANRTTEELLSTEMVRRMSAIGRRSSPNQLAGIKLLAPDLLRQGRSVIVDACSTKIARPSGLADDRPVRFRAHPHRHRRHRPCDVPIPAGRAGDRAGVPEGIIRQHADRMPHAIASIPSEGWGDIVTVTGRVEGSRTASTR
jgi:hypothetical protein